MRRGLFIVACASVVLASSSGCVLPRDHDALVARTDQLDKDLTAARAELAKTHADLEATRKRLDNALRANADSSTDLMSSKQRLNDMSGRLDEVQHGLDQLTKDMNASRTELYARIDDLKRALQQAQTPAAPPIQIPTSKRAHRKALEEAYAKRDWATVRALAPEYVNRYPKDDHADEALFYVADADLKDNRPTSALGNFNRLLKLFPRSNMLDKTLFNMGEAYLMLHDCVNAKVAYDACEKRYSRQKIGAEARAKMAQIAKNPPGLCAPP